MFFKMPMSYRVKTANVFQENHESQKSEKNSLRLLFLAVSLHGRNRPSKWRTKGSDAGSHLNMLKAPKRKVKFASQ